MRIAVQLDAVEVKRRADFVGIISHYTRLRRAGTQCLGLCPFHSESSPSFYVHPERKIWKCFGCERGGDVFDFVMLAEGCDFSSALRIVAGVARESEPRSGERFRAGEGAKPLSARSARLDSQKQRALILAALDATETRLAVIRAANDAAFAEFERACESDFARPASGYELPIMARAQRRTTTALLQPHVK